MRIIFVTILTALLNTSAFTQIISPEAESAYSLSYEVNRVYPAVTVDKEMLNEAHSLSDLNSNYKSSWVKEYISVEVEAMHKGKKRKALSKSEILSQEQKETMTMADVGTAISVKVHYIPENTLVKNEAKEIHFTFTVDPDQQAMYTGGQEQLRHYIKLNVVDKVPDNIFGQYQLAAIKFAIDENGKVTDANIFWSSEDEKTDELLLETVRNMTGWKPAEYADGTRAKQEFVLTVGDMESCVVNLLKIHPH